MSKLGEEVSAPIAGSHVGKRASVLEQKWQSMLGVSVPLAHLLGAFEERTTHTTVCSDLAGSKRILETEESPSARGPEVGGHVGGDEKGPLWLEPRSKAGGRGVRVLVSAGIDAQ